MEQSVEPTERFVLPLVKDEQGFKSAFVIESFGESSVEVG
jgi:hypothetical protein